MKLAFICEGNKNTLIYKNTGIIDTLENYLKMDPRQKQRDYQDLKLKIERKKIKISYLDFSYLV